MTQRDGGRVSIWEPAMSETPHTTTVGINTRTAGLRFQVQAEDCVAIAAQLMAVAEEMQGIQLPANFDTQNHSHLITDRIPADDEHGMWPLDMLARIRELEASLKECTEWMEQLRASGDAGFWEWEKESKYTKAQELLNKNP